MERDAAELQAAGAGAQHRDVMQDIFLQVRAWEEEEVVDQLSALCSKLAVMLSSAADCQTHLTACGMVRSLHVQSSHPAMHLATSL